MQPAQPMPAVTSQARALKHRSNCLLSCAGIPRQGARALGKLSALQRLHAQDASQLDALQLTDLCSSCLAVYAGLWRQGASVSQAPRLERVHPKVASQFDALQLLDVCISCLLVYAGLQRQGASVSQALRPAASTLQSYQPV